MPQVGDIKPAREIGKNGNGARYIHIACPDCTQLRWVRFLRGKPETTRCYDCARKIVTQKLRGKHNPLWRGGRFKSDGYISVVLAASDEFFRPMTHSRGRIPEHRLVMAKHLLRCLLPWEVVHHKNGIRDDNKIENLQLLPAQYYHLSDIHMKAENKRLHNRINRLEKEILLLGEGRNECSTTR